MEDLIKEPDLSYPGKYTYADYVTWNVKDRFEILKGRLFKMSPAPAPEHQKVLLNLVRNLDKFSHQKCEMYIAPFDVRLKNKQKDSVRDEDIETVFQPDICVICDPAKLDERGCIGAPDLIVEILSPGNSVKEMKHKFEIYEENGVREYWMVDYREKTVLIYVLKNGKYYGLKILTQSEKAKSIIFPGLEIDLMNVFLNNIKS